MLSVGPCRELKVSFSSNVCGLCFSPKSKLSVSW